MNESEDAIARDVAAVSRISVVPAMLRAICKHTGLGFAAVARVTDESWTACAVQDNIQFGIRPGGKLDISTTLCLESRAARRPVVIDHATNDPIYRDHPTPRIYHIESYISVPIILSSGEYFGNLCAVDPRPAVVSDTRTVAMFTLFAELIAVQLESEGLVRGIDPASRPSCPSSVLREQYSTALYHDLRSPINTIAVTAQALSRTTAEPEFRTMGETLEAASTRLMHVVDNLVDFTSARLGSGISVEKIPVHDLDVTLQSVVDTCRTRHPDRDITSTITISQLIICDRLRVAQLLSNLLENALEHGPQQRNIKADVKVERGMLVIRVWNSGTPIPQDELIKVFEPRTRTQASRHGQGLGLELYLCGQIVNAHAGSLQVSSSAADGTWFVAMLPIGQ